MSLLEDLANGHRADIRAAELLGQPDGERRLETLMGKQRGLDDAREARLPLGDLLSLFPEPGPDRIADRKLFGLLKHGALPLRPTLSTLAVPPPKQARKSLNLPKNLGRKLASLGENLN